LKVNVVYFFLFFFFIFFIYFVIIIGNRQHVPQNEDLHRFGNLISYLFRPNFLKTNSFKDTCVTVVLASPAVLRALMKSYSINKNMLIDLFLKRVSCVDNDSILFLLNFIRVKLNYVGSSKLIKTLSNPFLNQSRNGCTFFCSRIQRPAIDRVDPTRPEIKPYISNPTR
jgi:hypothetical protein